MAVTGRMQAWALTLQSPVASATASVPRMAPLITQPPPRQCHYRRRVSMSAESAAGSCRRLG